MIIVYIILGLLAISSALQYFKCVFTTPVLLGLFIGYIVVLILWFTIPTFFKKHNEWLELTEADKRDIEEAKAKDMENERINKKKADEAKKKRKEWVEKDAAESRQRMTEISCEIKECERQLSSNNLLAKSETNLDVINYLIDVMERRRADSIKEALNLYDNEMYRRKKDAEEKGDRMMREIQDKWDREDREKREREEAWQNQLHRSRMESLEKERLNEVKEVNKKLEDMKRGW